MIWRYWCADMIELMTRYYARVAQPFVSSSSLNSVKGQRLFAGWFKKKW